MIIWHFLDILLEIETPTSPVKIISQSRAAGSPIVKGTTLKVVVAKKPTPTETESEKDETTDKTTEKESEKEETTTQ